MIIDDDEAPIVKNPKKRQVMIEEDEEPVAIIEESENI